MATQNAVEDTFSTPVRGLSFSVAATTELPPVNGKPTKQCLIGPRYVPSDAPHTINFNRYLPDEQPRMPGCVVTTLVPNKEATDSEWAATVLGVPVDTLIPSLEKLLKERMHTMSLVQIEEMVERTERKVNTGMRTDGWSSFCFVENEDGTVSVLAVYYTGHWHKKVFFRLADGTQWNENHRLLVRNFGASKL